MRLDKRLQRPIAGFRQGVWLAEPPPKATGVGMNALNGVSSRAARGMLVAIAANVCVWPSIAEVQHPDFFASYALQSGQHYWTRPPWRVAGVDFPVGAPPDGQRDPLADGVLPAGCRYLPNRNWLVCGPPATDVTLDRLDFSLHGCVQAVFDPHLSGTVTISNSKFADGPGCESGRGSSLVVSNGVTSANLVFIGNDIDGQAGVLVTWPQCNPVTNCMSHDVEWRTTGSVTIENNAFLNTAARAVEAQVGVSAVYRGNYVEGIWGNTAHAEFQLTNSMPDTKPSFLLANNTFLQPANIPNAAVTGWDVVTEFPATFSTVIKTRNIFIANKLPTVRATVAWIDEANGLSIDSLTRSENYFDPTGSFGCYGPVNKKTGKTTYRGNVNLLSASDNTVNMGSPYCAGASH